MVYRYTLPGHSKIFAGAGPAIACGVFGNGILPAKTIDVFEESFFKRFYVGLNFLAGAELASGIMFSINITPGLENITGPDLNVYSDFAKEDIKWTNSPVVGISVGYMI